METKGICALCQSEAPLCKSHFLPRAMYKKISTWPDPRISVVNAQDTFFPRGRGQAVNPLLCRNCEVLFSLYEKQALSYCLGDTNHSKLIDNLSPKKGSFIGQGLDGVLYPPSEYENILDTRVFYYFTLSILWRGSVCRWGTPGLDLYYHSLGPYQESIRKYLLENKELSVPNVYMACLFNHGFLKGPIAYFPCHGKIDNSWVHEFMIPGIRFVIFIGNKPHPIVTTIFTESRFALLIADLANTGHERMLIEMIGKATPRGKMINKTNTQ